MLSATKRMNYILEKLWTHRMRAGIAHRAAFLFWKVVWKRYQIKYLLSFPANTRCGRNMKILHYGNIVVNGRAVFGDNVTIANGVTVGAVHSGPRCGIPSIGSDVFIGANAIIIGGVKIGNNVIIEPGAFINFDVPDNSLVIGNPGVIHKYESHMPQM